MVISSQHSAGHWTVTMSSITKYRLRIASLGRQWKMRTVKTELSNPAFHPVGFGDPWRDSTSDKTRVPEAHNN